ncbi:MAG: NusG domain II-containing protein [Clostridia bacterium]|nr:NusG domain II-containing protein [Clostridia bacterium]
MKYIKRLDVILVFFLLSAAVLMLIFNNIKSNGEDNQTKRAVVTKDSSVIYDINLKDIDKSYYLELDDDYNVLLLVESDGVSFVHSDCPDKVCINTGKITENGQSAICLPARVSVKIKSDKESDIIVTG